MRDQAREVWKIVSEFNNLEATSDLNKKLCA